MWMAVRSGSTTRRRIKKGLDEVIGFGLETLDTVKLHVAVQYLTWDLVKILQGVVL